MLSWLAANGGTIGVAVLLLLVTGSIIAGFLQYNLYFLGWQLPLMGQLPQLQPQEDFPFL